MKNTRLLLYLTGFLAWSLSAFAQITTLGSVSPGAISYGASVTITRDGTADAGIAFTDATVWTPDGGYDALNSTGLGEENYTPHSGAGTYWLQFRIIDNNYAYADQWISFTVNPGAFSFNGSVTPDSANYGDSVTITRDGAATRGVAFTDATVWAPDGSYDSLGMSGFGSATYTPHGGPGTYWLQFRIVDNDINYDDQWISFTLN